MLGSVTQACRILLLGDEKYGFRCRRVPFILTSFCLAPFGNENGLKCRLKVSCCTLGRRKGAEVSPKSVVLYPRATKSVGFVAEESLHPYVILPYTHGQQKWTEVSPESVVLHPRATKMRDSVAQACRAALSGDENARQCCPSVSCCTLGRRKCTEVLPKRAALHPRATNSVGFVAEESHSSLRHSALHPRATKMRDSVAQACRAAPSGDENARQCCPSVLCCTLGRRKCTKVLPKRAALHPRATKKR